jgi:hypothetical protein
MKLTKERRESITKSQNIVGLMDKVTNRLQKNEKASKVSLADIAERMGKEMAERKSKILNNK